MKSVKFSLSVESGPHSIGDEITLIDSEGVSGKATILSWDSAGARCRIVFTEAFANANYVVTYNRRNISNVDYQIDGVLFTKKEHAIDILIPGGTDIDVLVTG